MTNYRMMGVQVVAYVPVIGGIVKDPTTVMFPSASTLHIELSLLCQHAYNFGIIGNESTYYVG